MNPYCKYEVKTYWGCFRLDEGAYLDYLADKLWITWVPGHARQSASTAETVAQYVLPPQVTKRAAALRDTAAKNGLLETLAEVFPGGEIPMPYQKRMSGMPIEEMNLSVRSINGLKRAGAHTFGRVMELLERESGLRGVRNLGAKSEREIRQGFIICCYNELTQNERAVFWQRVLDSAENEELF